jgi:DNA polymerase IV (DinB-like DNA polymerase)
MHSKTLSVWTSDIFTIKKIAVQLLSEFIGLQKFRLIGIGVTKIREKDEKQALIADFL